MYVFYLEYLEIYKYFMYLSLFLNCIMLLSSSLIYFTNLLRYNWSTINFTYLNYTIWSFFDFYMYPWNHHHSQIMNISITGPVYCVSIDMVRFKYSVLLLRLHLSVLCSFFSLLLFLVKSVPFKNEFCFMYISSMLAIFISFSI